MDRQCSSCGGFCKKSGCERENQSNALRLADELEQSSNYLRSVPHQAAAELRRLHEVNVELVEALAGIIRGVPDTWEGVVKAKAALDKAKGK